MPAFINPLMVLVKVTGVTDKGYLVDEPVGEVNNEECIFDTRNDAEGHLLLMYGTGVAKTINDLDTHLLDGLRDFLKEGYKKFNLPVPEMRAKERGKEWFNIDDLMEKN